MSHALVRRDDDPDLLTLGQILVDSGYFRDARDQAQAIVKVLAGREYGMGPFASMTGIHVVEGKPTLSAHLMAQGIKRSGRYDYRVLEHDASRCTIAFYEVADGKREEIGRVTYTVEDAARADLARKQNHQRYPRAMLFARALSEGYRTHCPDALGACGPTYVEGEIEAEPVTVQATVVEQRPDPIPESPRDKHRERRAALKARMEALPGPHTEAEASRLAALEEQLQVLSADRLTKAEEWVTTLENMRWVATLKNARSWVDPQCGCLRSPDVARDVPCPSHATNKQGEKPSRGDVSSPAVTEILSHDIPKAGSASPGQGSSVAPAPIPPLGDEADLARALSPEAVARDEAQRRESTKANVEAKLRAGLDLPRERAPKVEDMDPGKVPARRKAQRGRTGTVGDAVQEVARDLSRMQGMSGAGEDWTH